MIFDVKRKRIRKFYAMLLKRSEEAKKHPEIPVPLEEV
jgi:hypothetical protein